jgi:hypothetical protein
MEGSTHKTYTRTYAVQVVEAVRLLEGSSRAHAQGTESTGMLSARPPHSARKDRCGAQALFDCLSLHRHARITLCKKSAHSSSILGVPAYIHICIHTHIFHSLRAAYLKSEPVSSVLQTCMRMYVYILMYI